MTDRQLAVDKFERCSITAQLVMEVIAARYRLGEPTWNFRRVPLVDLALREAEVAGLLGYKMRRPGFWDVWLTPTGELAMFDPEYQPPVFGTGD